MLCDSPLCRDGIVVIKFTKSRKLPRHCFNIKNIYFQVRLDYRSRWYGLHMNMILRSP